MQEDFSPGLTSVELSQEKLRVEKSFISTP